MRVGMNVLLLVVVVVPLASVGKIRYFKTTTTLAFTIMHTHTHLFGRLLGKLKSDTETGQVEQWLDIHVIGRRQELKQHFPWRVPDKIAVPFLGHALCQGTKR